MFPKGSISWAVSSRCTAIAADLPLGGNCNDDSYCRVRAQDDFRPFPWATHADLNSQCVSNLIGKCVQINEYKVNVLSCNVFGRTGPTFEVAVVEPKSENGVILALQFRQGHEAVESLARVAEIFVKMDENGPVPHAVSMRTFGPLRVPRKLLCGCITFQPRQGDTGKALLMTLACGSPLKSISFDGDEERTTFKKQMAEFAECMYSKELIHGSLASDTIYWNPSTQEATIIDFGDAVNSQAHNKAQNNSVVHQAAATSPKDALHEMVRFLRETFGDDEIRAHSRPGQLDVREELDLLASGDDWRSIDIHGKHEM